MMDNKRLYFIIAIIPGFFYSSLMASDDKDSASKYYQQALFYKQKVNTLGVSKLFEKAIEYDSLNTDLRVEYAGFLLDNMKNYNAIEQLHLALMIDPTHEAALLKITQASFMLHRWNDVINYGSRISATIGMDYMLGKAYYENEDYNLAKPKLNEAVRQDPKNVSALTFLGKVYIELDEYSNAISAYKQALDLNADDPYMIYEYGLLYYAMNDERQAVKYFELAVNKGYVPDLDFTENLGMAYLAYDVDKGVEILSKVLVKKPGNKNILMQEAYAWFKKKQYDTAIEVYEKTYKLDPTNYRALYMLGIIHIKRGDKFKGNELCEKAIKLDPTLQGMRRLSFLN